MIYAVYFSPTGGTNNVINIITDYIGVKLNEKVASIDFTSHESRQKIYTFTKNDVLIIGSPTYAGRIPNKIMPDFKKSFVGNQALCIPIVSFGNRDFDHSLLELQQIMEENNFRIIGAAAIATRHAFSDKLASNRPDEADRKEIYSFCDKLIEKLQTKEFKTLPSVLDRVIPPYYTPLKEDGTPAKFLKAKPITDTDQCNQCGICAQVCPMGSIDIKDVTNISGICIKCHACVHKCPKRAKFFDDDQFLSHVKMLETNYIRRFNNYYIL